MTEIEQMGIEQDALIIEGMSGGYDASDVLEGISLRVGARERVGLFGPNGHGKTTLLNALSATLPRARGRIRFFGQDLAGLSAKAVVEAGLIHVPQANVIFPEMEIMETLELASAWTARARAAKAENIDRVLGLFPRLAERKRQQAKTLSGGERQMLSVGVGLMCAPRMLMLDEPTLGLSPLLKDELAAAIGRISAEGMPILLVEQDIAFVLSLVDRMYLVDHGQIAREIDRSGGAAAGLDHGDIMEMYFGTGDAA
jgi:branched-chain amino acid transport system ATP-binding protein